MGLLCFHAHVPSPTRAGTRDNVGFMSRRLSRVVVAREPALSERWTVVGRVPNGWVTPNRRGVVWRRAATGADRLRQAGVTSVRTVW